MTPLICIKVIEAIPVQSSITKVDGSACAIVGEVIEGN